MPEPIDLSKFHFSVIYSVDAHKDINLTRNHLCPPPVQFARKLWECTESGPSELGDDDFAKTWKHRKYCSFLNFQQFCDFIEHTSLYVERTQTMGSLGAPGFGFGWAPAVPFNGDSGESGWIQNAYVTPVPPELMSKQDPAPILPGLDPEMVELATHTDWDEIEKTMWEWFEEGAWSARNFAEDLAEVAVA